MMHCIAHMRSRSWMKNADCIFFKNCVVIFQDFTVKMHTYILKTTSWTNFNQTWNITSGLKELTFFRWISMGDTCNIAKRQKHIYEFKKVLVSLQKLRIYFHLSLALGIQACSNERPRPSSIGEHCGII